MKKIIPAFYYILMNVILILTIIFNNKEISLGLDLNVSVSLFIYAFTYFITGILIYKYRSEKTKKLLFTTTIGTIIFFAFITILCSISANTASQTSSIILRHALAPNYLLISKTPIFYPNILPIISLLTLFLLTHYIMIIVYEALENYANYFIAFTFSLLISFIINVMFYVPINNVFHLLNTDIDIIDIIKILTANFLVVIASSVCFILIYPLCIKKALKPSKL